MRAKQTMIICADTEGLGPCLLQQAKLEGQPGERPNVSRIIRRAIRAELERCSNLATAPPVASKVRISKARLARMNSEL